MTRQLNLLPYKVNQELRIDYKAFVSIDSKDFKRVVLEINAHSGNHFYIPTTFFLLRSSNLCYYLICNYKLS